MNSSIFSSLGDSGGPLVCIEEGKAVITGVASFGFKWVPNESKVETSIKDQQTVIAIHS